MNILKAIPVLIFLGLIFSCETVKANDADAFSTQTPIKHVIVIINENASFDHYFGTYPNALNPPGEPQFTPAQGTPAVNGLLPNSLNSNRDLIHHNPNSVQPFRLDPKTEFFTCSQNHEFDHEEAAADGGLMDKFVENTGQGDNPLARQPYLLLGLLGNLGTTGCDYGHGKGIVMGYYDGNTVTALWNYAQHFAMSDNTYQTTYGISLGGYLNLISGDDHGGTLYNKDYAPVLNSPSSAIVFFKDLLNGGIYNYNNTPIPIPAIYDSSFNPLTRLGGFGGTALINLPPPFQFDYYWAEQGFNNLTDPSNADTFIGTYLELFRNGDSIYNTITLNAIGDRNIGDLLNEKGISWGYFIDGFDPNIVNPNGSTGFFRSHDIATGLSAVPTVNAQDYDMDPFQYFASTSNPLHLRPLSAHMIGKQGDQANHQYDYLDFVTALKTGNLPAVSFVRAAEYQDGHPESSTPLEQQKFLVNLINLVQSSPDWKSTAIFVVWDDSDGGYDHQAPPVVRGSNLIVNLALPPFLSELPPPQYASTTDGTICSHPSQLPRLGMGSGNCGYGERLPLLVISPYAKKNFVSHAVTDQTSITRFIEDNWLDGERINPPSSQYSGSFDNIAGPLNDMFDFSKGYKPNAPLYLNPDTGLTEPIKSIVLGLLGINIASAGADPGPDPAAIFSHKWGGSLELNTNNLSNNLNIPSFNGVPVIPPESAKGHGNLVAPPILVASFSASSFATYINAIPTLGPALIALAGQPANGVDFYYIQYSTLDDKGKPTTASGVIMLPQGVKGPMPIVLYAHGTTSQQDFNIANILDPTNEAFYESVLTSALFAAQGFIVVAPNYVGYDTSRLAYHPYLNAKQESREMLDILQAARKTLLTLHTPKGETGEIFLTGYSEGGYVALATMRAMERHSMPVAAAAPCAGPYPLEATIDANALGATILGATTVFPYAVESWQNTYGNVYSNPSDVYATSPYNYSVNVPTLFPLKFPLQDLMMPQQLPAAEFNINTPTLAEVDAAGVKPPLDALLVSKMQLPANPIYDAGFGNAYLLTNSFRIKNVYDAIVDPDGFIAGDHCDSLAAAQPSTGFRADAYLNDLRNNGQWSPKAPLLLVGAAEDPVVGFFNAQVMKQFWSCGSHPLTINIYSVDPYPNAPSDPLQADFLQTLGGYEATNGQLLTIENYHALLEPPFDLYAARKFFIQILNTLRK